MFEMLRSKLNKKTLTLIVAALLLLAGVSAQASGILNTPSGGYLICVNSKTKFITHPGTSSCPKGSKKLVLGAQGLSGKDGKTLWNGIKDPENTVGVPGDMFINTTTKVLFGPKDSVTGWNTGVSLVGPQGPGGSGPVGATGPSSLKITEQSICGAGGTSLCTIGSQGPGGGLIFFVDYNDQYAGFNYLEAAPTDGMFAGSQNVGVWATTATNCGGASDASCQQYSIYTQSGVDLAAIKGTHRGLFGGQAATNAIIAKHGSGVARNLYAAGVADSYTAPAFNGVTKSDYYLPTKDEIELMQKNLNNVGVGEFVGSLYWSSSENVANSAWFQYFDRGDQGNYAKDNFLYVRPVRAF